MELTVLKVHLVDAVRDDVLLKQQATPQGRLCLQAQYVCTADVSMGKSGRNGGTHARVRLLPRGSLAVHPDDRRRYARVYLPYRVVGLTPRVGCPVHT